MSGMTRSIPSISSSGNFESGVDEEQVVAVFDESCVLADLADTAKGNDADGMVRQSASNLRMSEQRKIPLTHDLRRPWAPTVPCKRCELKNGARRTRSFLEKA